ncbi:outer membrane protein [Rhizobium sp. PP-F2F-G38]|nr:outer membrane protein [Rhizobium sp. PP-WC-1G-195]PYE95393.1 outer membrane protein [Rhizobium sp. PP-F2F-G38]
MTTMGRLCGQDNRVLSPPSGDDRQVAFHTIHFGIILSGIMGFLAPGQSASAQDAALDTAGNHETSAAPISGLGAGDLLIRARISGVLPYDLHTRIDLIGGTIEVPRLVLPDLDISYFLTDHIAITGQAGALKTRFKIRDSLYGDIDVGSIWTLPLALSADYHLLPDARINPYIGLGAVATWYKGAKPASPLVKDFSVERQISPMIRAGMDVQITETWFANTEMRLVLPPTQVLTNSGVTARTDVKSLSLGFGVSYRF